MRTLGTIFVAVGVIALLAALVNFTSGVWFRTRAEEVTGEVVEVALRHYADGNAYCPVIRYTTRDSQTFVHKSDICAWPAAYQQGEQVRMYVDPTNPENVQLHSFFAVWFFPPAYGFLGLPFRRHRLHDLQPKPFFPPSV